MNPQTVIAQKAAFRARRIIHQIYDRIDKLSPEQRADTKIFLEFYEQVEAELIKEIQTAYPHHSIIGKYTSLVGKAHNPHKWYISGICGKENFISHTEYFSLSLAYEMNDKTMSAVVYNPITDRTYMASKNEGAQLNEKRIRLGKHSGKLSDALILTSVSASTDSFDSLTKINKEALGLRIFGDHALDICQIAEGAASAFWSADYHECDVKAALLIAQEAGALVTDFIGGESFYQKNELVVSHAKLLKALLQTMNS